MSNADLNQQPAPQLVSSTCAYCGVGCGVDVALHSSQDMQLSGTREHPANFGRLCVKGTHLLDTLVTESVDDGRLSVPQINGQPVQWQDALAEVADVLSRTIAKHGPDSVAFYVSGQLLTEDYYIANKLMKGYLGSANIDTNSRLCMSSAVSAYKRAFGEDVVPCDYRDLELADVLVLVGSNAAWTHPVLFQRMERAKLLRPHVKLIVIDPRTTPTAASSDLHLPIRPGTDGAIFNGLLQFIHDNDALDKSFIEHHTQGFEQALAASQTWTVEHTAAFCDIDKQDLIQFYRWFCEHQKVVSFYSMGINQSSSGVDKCNAIINCHLATGALLRPGAGPFSITGQPNAMGGREVGGLANQLAAHLDIDNPDHQHAAQTFWNGPNMATTHGLKAVDMFDAIEQGKIKVVWVMATNPMVSLPNRKRIEAALTQCEYVIVSDCVSKNDTLAFADIVLPATGWSEKDGTVTNSERRISRQRAFVQPYGQARHDWQILCDVAKEMGFSGFDFTHQSEIFDEWARMTQAVNRGQRQLDLGPLAGMSEQQYNQLAPVQWPFNAAGESVRPFANKQFSTPSQKAQFVAITPQAPAIATSNAYPLTLNSGRLRDQWHTMTRTGRASALTEHTAFPQLHIHTDTARKLSIAEGDIVSVNSEFGSAQAYAAVGNKVRRDDCFMPIHFNQQVASSGSVSALYSSVTDPLSGQPESKQVPVAVSAKTYARYISVFSDNEFDVVAPFWVKARRQNALHYEIATSDEDFSLHQWSLCQYQGQGEWVSSSTDKGQVSLLIRDKALVWVSFAFVSRQGQQALPAEWVTSLFGRPLELSDVTALLHRKPDDGFLRGRLVCSCFRVHEKDIQAAINDGARSVDELGQQLQCGTNCGSCKTELQQLLNVIPVRRVV